MRKLVVTNHLTLDGVMQAPARADEDPRGGFSHGGWAEAGQDEVMGRFVGRRMTPGGALLLGRRTYEDFAAVWPQRTDSPFSAVLDNAQKYVVSTTLTEPLPWRNSTLLPDATTSVAELKAQPGPDLGVLGSGRLVEALARANLVDEYVLMIHPLVLGVGRRLFTEPGTFAKLTLLDTVTTSTGVIIATYSASDADSDPAPVGSAGEPAGG
jgi:dihydrofolate reductase